MTRPPEKLLEREDVADWRRLAALLQRRWGSVLLVTGLTLAATVAYCLVARKTYESATTVRVGQVGLLGPQGDPGRSLVEPIARVAERLRMRQFQDACLEAAKEKATEGDPVARLYRRSLTGRLVPNTDLIGLSVRGYSPEASQRLLQTTVNVLAQTHSEIAAPAIQNLRSTALQVAAQLREFREDIDRLRRLEEARGKLPPGAQFTENVYVASYLSSRLDSIGRLQERQISLEEQLSPARTYPTAPVDPVRVDPDRTSPRLFRSLFIALAAGVLFGLLFALLRESLDATSQAQEPMALIRDERRI